MASNRSQRLNVLVVGDLFRNESHPDYESRAGETLSRERNLYPPEKGDRIRGSATRCRAAHAKLLGSVDGSINGVTLRMRARSLWGARSARCAVHLKSAMRWGDLCDEDRTRRESNARSVQCVF